MQKLISLFFITAAFFSPFAAFGSDEGKRLSAPTTVSADCSEFKFNQAPALKTGLQPKGVTIADLDGDGLADILVAF